MGKKRFSNKRKFNKSNVNAIPEDRPVVYEVLNSKNENIYTGIAKRNRPADRLLEHLPGAADPIPGAKAFRIKQMPSVEKAKAEERKIIKKEKPKHNDQGK